jgi:hypothetical protein
VAPLAHSTWYVTPSAVRDLLAIQGEPVHLESGPDWDAAVRELEAAVAYAIEGEADGRRLPQRLASGALRYRGPKPRRLSLVVTLEPRPEGSLPQVVSVTTGPRGGR